MVRPLTSLRPRLRLAAGALALSVMALPALARDDHAIERLKAMSDYIAGLNSITATFDSSVEVVTTDLENIQFNSSGTIDVARPDHLYVRRTGGFSDAEMFFDGKVLTISDATDHRYATLDVPGSVENLRDVLRRTPGVVLPGAEILGVGELEKVTAGLTDAKTIGPAVIGGELCEHLAFRTAEADFQLWVHMGDAPRPCKLVVSSKTVVGSPKYTLQITSFKADEAIDAATFTFTPAADAAKVDLTAIGDLDEIPPADGQ